MVNVPGRSKGCNTCRRRKKGCDLQKPVCARCVHDGLQCEGYARSTIFVSHEPQTQAGSTKVAAVRPKAAKVWRKDAAHDDDASSKSLVPLREDLMKAAFQHHLFGQFWDSYLPRGFLLSATTGPNGLVSHAWADDILRLAERSLPLRQALSAVSLSCLGNRENDPIQIRNGAECYGAAVVKLNHLLRTNAAVTDDAIIPTCQLLSSYEQFNGFGSTKTHAQGRNWQAHISGVARVLQLRGPQRHSAGSSQSIFAYSRYAQLAYWLVVRKACPFSSEAWTSLPWNGKEKTLRDKIIDIVLPVPGLLEACDTAAASDDEALRVRIIGDLLTIHRQVQDWRADAVTYIWTSDAANQGKEIDWAMAESDTYWMSHGTDVAASAITYWSLNVVLCSTLRALSVHVSEQYRINTYAGDRLDPQPYAMSIVANMKYFLHADAGLFGFQTISFPLATALVYFAAFNTREPHERALIRENLWGATAIMPYGPMIGTFLEQLGEEESKRRGVEGAAKKMERWEGDRMRSQQWFNIKEELSRAPTIIGPSPPPGAYGATPPAGAFTTAPSDGFISTTATTEAFIGTTAPTNAFTGTTAPTDAFISQPALVG